MLDAIISVYVQLTFLPFVKSALLLVQCMLKQQLVPTSADYLITANIHFKKIHSAFAKHSVNDIA